MPHETDHVVREDVDFGRHVEPGWTVFTCDGDELGKVKDVAAGFFKVDVRMAPDYWLQTQFIRECAAGRVTMEFSKDLADDYKVKNPPEAATAGVAEQAANPAGGYPETTAAATLDEAERRARS